MTAAGTEERAELEVLRARTDDTGGEAARTLAELAARLADARDPREMARRLTTRARRRVLAAMRALPVRALPDTRAARRAAVAALPVLGVVTVAAIAHRRGWFPSHSVIPNGGALRHRRLPSAVSGRA